METGHSKLRTGLTISDEISVSAIQLADLVMDSFRKSHNQVAVDHFVSGNIFVKEYLGQVVQYFKLKNLFLLELVIIAHMVHTSYPKYAILNAQCYYYAALVYAVAEKYGGITCL